MSQDILHDPCPYKEKIEMIDNNVSSLRVDIAGVKGDIKNLDTRINGSLEKISSHITEGTWYRRLIIGTALSLVTTIIGGIYTASQISFSLCQYANQIEVNTGKLHELERMTHERLPRQ